MADVPYPADFLAKFRQQSLLQAELATLSFRSDRAKVIELSSKENALREELSLPSRENAPEVSGVYLGYENLTAIYMIGAPPAEEFAFHAADFLARETATLVIGDVWNLTHFCNRLGPAPTALLFDVLEDAMRSCRQEYRRFKAVLTDEDGDEEIERIVYAPLTTSNPQFDDEGVMIMRCAADNVGATLITIGEFDDDLWTGALELIERRAEAARLVLRGQVATEALAQ